MLLRPIWRHPVNGDNVPGTSNLTIGGRRQRTRTSVPDQDRPYRETVSARTRDLPADAARAAQQPQPHGIGKSRVRGDTNARPPISRNHGQP
jgi:hypothetical protein